MKRDWNAKAINSTPAIYVVFFSSNRLARNAPDKTAKITHIAIPYWIVKIIENTSAPPAATPQAL